MSKMIFHRSEHTDKYTCSDNGFIQNKNLSWQAKGLFLYLLSLPDDWVLHVFELQNHATNRRTAIYSALKELKNQGYIKISGKGNNSTYEIFECPILENAENPYTENLNTEIPYTNIQPLQNTNNTKYLNNKILNKHTSDNDNILKKDYEIPNEWDVLCFAEDYCKENDIDCSFIQRQTISSKFLFDCKRRNWKDPGGASIKDWKAYFAKSYLDREKKKKNWLEGKLRLGD